VILASIFALVALFLPGEVIAVKEEAKTTKQIIRDVFADDGEDAILIAKCESQLNPQAVNYADSKLNGHVSRGLFQLSEIHGKLEKWDDPRTNIEAAKVIFDKQGWKPWRNCAQKLGLL